MSGSTSNNLKVAWVGAAAVVIAALIGASVTLLKKEESGSSVDQNSSETNSPNISNVKGDVNINIGNEKNTAEGQ